MIVLRRPDTGRTRRTVALSAAALCTAAVLTAIVVMVASSMARADNPVVTLFAADATPAVAAVADDDNAVELGVRFTPAVDGTITGLRFYQGPGNTGPHTGSLWSSSGALIATLTFPDSSATGWQTANFSSPVPVTASTTYVASYFAPHGHYAATANFFTAPVTNGPLTAPGTDNGLYRYGPTSGFPTDSFKAHNYWVDLLFVAAAVEQPPSPSPSASPSLSASPSASGSPSASSSASASRSPSASGSVPAGGTGSGSGSGGSLPVTGSNAILLAGSGLLLAGIGLALFLRSRRRNKVTFVA